MTTTTTATTTAVRCARHGRRAAQLDAVIDGMPDGAERDRAQRLADAADHLLAAEADRLAGQVLDHLAEHLDDTGHLPM